MEKYDQKMNLIFNLRVLLKIGVQVLRKKQEIISWPEMVIKAEPAKNTSKKFHFKFVNYVEE